MRGELDRDPRAIVSLVDAADLGAALDRVLVEPVEQLVVAVGVGAAPLLVGEAGVDDRAHHPERERRVGAGQRRQVLVGDPRGAAAERVDDDEPGAGAARVEELPPEVRRGRHRVPAPDEQVAGVRPLLGSTSGESPCVATTPAIPALAQIVRLELARAERVHQTRALIESPWSAPWVPR